MGRKSTKVKEPEELKSISLDDEYVEPEQQEEEVQSTKIGPFDIINALFTNKDFIWELTDSTASQNIFMVNRRMAINFPMEASFFNKSGVNALDVLKFWADFLYNGSRAPRWVYTKSEIAKQKKSADDYGLTREMKQKYADRNWLSMKDVEAMMRFFPDEAVVLIKENDELDKILNGKEQ